MYKFTVEGLRPRSRPREHKRMKYAVERDISE